MASRKTTKVKPNTTSDQTKTAKKAATQKAAARKKSPTKKEKTKSASRTVAKIKAFGPPTSESSAPSSSYPQVECREETGVAESSLGWSAEGMLAQTIEAPKHITENGLFDWQSRLETIPLSPGVYLMRDKEGKLLYIGKAKELKKRVRQYFQKGGDNRPFVRRLPRLLGDIEVLLTHTEREALLLEANLIREHRPPFNILLKEEKRYLYLTLDTSHTYPRLRVVRRSRNDRRPKPHVRLFGPFLSGYLVRETMNLIDQHFQLRTCEDREMRNRTRPCLEYQIKRCDGPCCLPVSPESYQERLQEVLWFLEGKHEELVSSLEQKLEKAVELWQYELAARYRDQLQAVKRIAEAEAPSEQKDRTDRDILGLYREGESVEIQVLSVRRGVLIGGQSFSFTDQVFEDEEVLEDFLAAYYLRDGVELPHQILAPLLSESLEALSEVLTERARRKVAIRVPQRGEGKRLLEMAHKNAEQGFLEKQKTEADTQAMLERLQKRLGLPGVPYRIECIDNSHMQGRYPVSAIVVFEGGYPNRSAYRRYHIKEAEKGDDFGAMKEILTRRFRRGIERGDLPDLLVVDGGKGQLSMALAALEDLGFDGVELAAIAKKRDPGGDATREDTPQANDRIFRPGRKNPIPVTPKHRELLVLSHIRDEAHKTAVTFHKRTREKAKLQSVLEEIPDVGPKRKKLMLQHLGSVKKVREASVEQLASVPGISESLATSIHAWLAENS